MSVEDVKRASGHLRGTLADELAGDTDDFEPRQRRLLKFHGIYQQDDRDVRRARRAKPSSRSTTPAWCAPPCRAAA